jgi:hypothetical protein
MGFPSVAEAIKIMNCGKNFDINPNDFNLAQRIYGEEDMMLCCSHATVSGVQNEEIKRHEKDDTNYLHFIISYCCCRSKEDVVVDIDSDCSDSDVDYNMMAVVYGYHNQNYYSSCSVLIMLDISLSRSHSDTTPLAWH